MDRPEKLLSTDQAVTGGRGKKRGAYGCDAFSAARRLERLLCTEIKGL